MSETGAKFTCPKCGSHASYLDEIRGSSGAFLAYMNVDDQKITLVICRQCKFIESYAMPKKEYAKLHGIEE